MKIYLLSVALFFPHFSYSGVGLPNYSRLGDVTDNKDDKSKVGDVTYNKDDASKVGDGGKGFYRNIPVKKIIIERKSGYKKMPATEKDDQEGMNLYYVDSEGVPRPLRCVCSSSEAACQRIEVNNEGVPRPKHCACIWLEIFQKAVCQKTDVNNEGKPFNENGLVYTSEETHHIHLSEVFNSPLEDVIKYANQRTHAFPDVCQELKVIAIKNGETRLTKIAEVSIIDLANLAYVSLFAVKEENKKSALDLFNKLKDQHRILKINVQ